MNEEPNDNDFSFFDLLDRFEQMLSEQTSLFFDSEEFEEIINFYLDTGDLKKARMAIVEARRQYPSENIFNLKYAQYLAASDQEQEALNILAHIERLEPRNSELYYTRGTIYSKLERHLEAIKEFNKALEYAEDPVDIYLNVSYEYQKLADYDAAIKVLLVAAEMDPDDEDIINELSFCYEFTDRLEEGVETFQRFLDNHPWSVQGWFSLGLIYNKLGLYEKSVEAFDFAITIEPTNTAAYFNKANAYSNAEMYEQAIAVYKEVLKQDEPDALTYCYIGDCYLKLERPEYAKDYFIQSLRHDDQLVEAWYGLALCNETLGKHTIALTNINKALQIDPYNPVYFHLRGEIYLSLKEYDKAYLDLKKAIDRADSPVELWVDISRVAVLGAIENEVIAFLASIEGTDKWHHFINLTLANIYLSIGRTKEAIQRIQRGLDALPMAKNELLSYFPEMRQHPAVVEFLALNLDENNSSTENQ